MNYIEYRKEGIKQVILNIFQDESGQAQDTEYLDNLKNGGKLNYFNYL